MSDFQDQALEHLDHLSRHAPAEEYHKIAAITYALIAIADELPRNYS